MHSEDSRELPIPLDLLLERAIDALSVLDAEAIEELAAVCARDFAEAPVSVDLRRIDWAKAARLHWVLGHLLGSTACRLAFLRRISAPLPHFLAYGSRTACGATFGATTSVDRGPIAARIGINGTS